MTNVDLATRFAREGSRHRFTARTVSVTHVTEVAGFIRVTLTSPELHDWASFGPSDHARTFFPDPATGALVAPAPAGPDIDGIVRPDAPMHGRDFTPINIHEHPETGQRSFDIDILRHDNAGPAARWAAQAEVGDELVVVGPRGSRAVASAAPRVLCFVDATALPAAARWISEMPADASVQVVVDASPEAGSDAVSQAEEYLRAQCGRQVSVVGAAAGFAEAAAELSIDENTYVFAAGEAGSLVPLRRFVRHELKLPREQYAITGYWKSGDAAFDHHAPIDPTDLDD
ncbi:siderophore-interacting protein [Leucobacter sp. HY1908]